MKEEHLGAKSNAHLTAAVIAVVVEAVAVEPLLTSNGLSREWREVVWPLQTKWGRNADYFLRRK